MGGTVIYASVVGPIVGPIVGNFSEIPAADEQLKGQAPIALQWSLTLKPGL